MNSKHSTCPHAASGCNWPEGDCLDLCMPVQVVRWPEDDRPDVMFWRGKSVFDLTIEEAHEMNRVMAARLAPQTMSETERALWNDNSRR